MSSTTKIAHESEVQRQHIRINLQATAAIDGVEYKILNLSSGGFNIEAKDKIFPATVQDTKIHFKFDHFSFTLDAKARSIYNKEGQAGFTFTDLEARQVSLLNYIIKSYLSGLLVSENDLINIAARNNFMPARDNAKSNDNKNWMGRVLPFAFISGIGLLGLFFLFANLYENTLIIKSPFGIVEGTTYTIRAEQNGVYQSLLSQGVTKVNRDQPIAILKSDPALSAEPREAGIAGDYTLKSPCNCVVVSQAAKDGEFYIMGDQLMQLVPADARPWVTANLDPEKIHRLKIQDTAEFKLVGENKFLSGYITEFLPPAANKPYVQVKIKPVEPLPVNAVGRQAYVEMSIY